MPRKPSAATMSAAQNFNGVTGQDVVSAIFAEDPNLARQAADAGVIALSAPAPGETRQTVSIPDDNASLFNIYNFITGYEPNRNAFLYALMNRIGMTILTSRMWNSPLSWMFRGTLEFGESVEEIFVNLAKVQSFDPSKGAERAFKRTIPDVRAAFHVMNWQKMYPVTVTSDQLRQAFLSWQGIVDLVQGIISSLYKSLQKDMYETAKYMLAKLILQGKLKSVAIGDVFDKTAPEYRDVLTSAVQTEQEIAFDMTILKTDYTMAGVYNAVESISELRFILPKELASGQNVQVLAQAFNMDKAEFMGQMTVIDSFSEFDYNRLDMLFTDEDTQAFVEGYKHFDGTELTALQGVGGLIVGPEFMQCYDNFQEVTDNYNGAGLYWNYWLHAWKTFSVSPFEVAAVFTSTTGEITSVAVDPATANVAQGTTLTLGATVEGTGIYDQDVTFSIRGQTKDGTQVVGNQLTIAVDEPAETQITVTATAKDGQTGTGAVTVVAR